MVVLVWVPQMIYWKEMTGRWLYFSYGSDERFFFGDPAIIKGLFSYRKGLFIYTPLLLFAFAGVISLWLKTFAACPACHIVRTAEHLYNLFMVVLVVRRRIWPESVHRQLCPDGRLCRGPDLRCNFFRQEMAQGL